MNKNYIALMYSFTQKKDVDKLMDEYKKFSFSGGTICYGNGAATSKLWRLVGFDGPERAVLFNYVTSSMLSDYLKEEKRLQKIISYQCAVVPLNKQAVSEIIKSEGIMEMDLSLIQVICNKGYSSEIVEASRAMGAPGATILSGRGTARKEDVAFFGSKLVHEKDIILIITPRDKSNDIINGIQNLECMQKEASGIVMCLPAVYFSKAL